ncbi:hypothetical protein ACKKBF_B04995 [Auxenochlorella protothecoides x Auxenochlorella symbiontica]|uniref:tetraacyldisaccharide 4'-kinase n=2 Tax=Auxenochlorella protothecoides TaxID=3075 RepID=A0A1D2A434_AUXPR
MGPPSSLRIAIQQSIRQIQRLDDSQIKTLSPAARYLIAPGLSFVAGLTAASNSVRGWLARNGLRGPIPLPVPVIGIGSLTSVGTGKTPFVEFLARHYGRAHATPSLILQAGPGAADEIKFLAEVLDGQPADAAPVASPGEARAALTAHPAARLVLLDDGLRSLRLLRDMEVVCVNCLEPLGNGRLRPRGTLREPARAALRRADAVVLHHADLAGEEEVGRVEGTLAALAPRHTLFMRTRMAPLSLRSLIPPAASLDMSEAGGLGGHVSLARLHGAHVVCLVGVGLPASVEAHVRGLGAAAVEGAGDHPDHHEFELEEVQAAIARVRELQGTPGVRHACLIMTEKDYARQRDLFEAIFSQHAAAPDVTSGPLEEGAPRWGAYLLQSGLEVVQHDRRFSGTKAVFNAVLRLANDNFRQRNYVL